MSLSLVVLSLLVAVPVFAGPPPGARPDFGPHIYVGGVAWGSEVTTALPHPDDAEGSFDVLHVFLDKYGSPQPLENQLLVADAAPGDTDYNSGRWEVFTAQCQIENPYELTSAEALRLQ